MQRHLVLITLLLVAFIQNHVHAVRPDAGSARVAYMRFVKEKHALAKRIAARDNLHPNQVVWDFFAALERNDRQTATNLFQTLSKAAPGWGPSASLPPLLWSPILDVYGANEMFDTWSPQLLQRWGSDVMNSIPADAVYFGGSDAGRFILSALSTSHTEGKPFYTLTQNALADGNYLDYLQEIYGQRLSIPGPNQRQLAFQEYLQDVQRRMEQKQLLEGEEVTVANGRVQVSGEAAVMMINERLVRAIMAANPRREFYLEESRPLMGLYSNSVPHGLIFKLSPTPFATLPERAIEKDHTFWAEQVSSLLGKDVTETTTVAALCSWVEQVHLRTNLTAFSGMRSYLSDKQAPQYYSQCRSAIASLYQWRSERQLRKSDSKWATEADFAHRQAVALSPYHPAVVDRYAGFLLQQQRINDVKVLVQTCLRLQPESRMDIDGDWLKKSLAHLRQTAKELRVEQ